MFKRVMGKASFCNIQDLKGRIQAYVARESIGEESYEDFKKYDVGDILGIKGTVFKTKQARSPSMHRGNSAFQEFTDPSGEIPRTDRYRYQISSEIC